jgi:iron complex transport system substrate-binding protein
MGKNTTADEFIDLAGGSNVFTAEGYKPVNAEAVAASEADIIMIPDGSLQGLGGKEALKEIPGIAQTPAGQRLAVVTVDDSLLAGLGPRTAPAVKLIRRKISKEMRGK